MKILISTGAHTDRPHVMNTQDLFIIVFIMICPVQGTEYLFAVHHIKDGSHSPTVSVEVDENGGTLYYTCPYYNLNQSRNVRPNGSIEIQIYEALWTSTEVEYKGILVTSTNNEANIEVGSQVISFAPLPTTALGTKYIVSSCYKYRFNSLLVIAAYNLTTSISITTSSRIFGPTFQRDNTRILELKPFQTFTFQHGSDLTGTVITSTQPVAVFSGLSNSTLVTAYDQLLPVRLHNKEYVVAVDNNPALYHLQVLSVQNDTVITFNNGSSLTVDSALYKAQLTPLERFYFQSSNPVTVTICRQNGSQSGFVVIPPVSLYSMRIAHFRKDYSIFITPEETFINSTYTRWMSISNSGYKAGVQSKGSFVTKAFGCNLLYYPNKIITSGITYRQVNRIAKKKSYLVALPKWSNKYTHLQLCTSQTSFYQVVFPRQNQTKTQQILPALHDSFYIEEDMKMKAGVENKAIRVDVDTEDNMLAMRENSGYNSLITEIFPTSFLGREYIVQACYSNIPSEFQLIIVSSISNTEVNVLPSKAITYNGLEYKPGETIREQLQPYQTLTINSSVALCGTHVSASHDVAVFTLSRFGNIIADYNQLLPVSHYGQQYIVVACDQGSVEYFEERLDSFSSEYYVLVTSATNLTQILLNDNLQVTVKAGISYRKTLQANESLHLSSTKPVMVSLCTDVSATFRRTKQLDQSGCRIIIPRSLYTTKTTFMVETRKIIKIVTESTASDVMMIWSGGYDWNVSVTWETHRQYKVGTAVVDAGQISVSSMDRFTTVAFSIRERYVYSGSSNILGNLWNPFGWNHERENDGKNGNMTTVFPDVCVPDDHVNITLVATGTTLGVLILFLLAVIICQQLHIRRNTGHKGEKADARTEKIEASLQGQQRDTENMSYVSAARAYSELNTEPQVTDAYEDINPSFSSHKNDKYENVESIF